MEKQIYKYLEIKGFENGEVVKRFDITDYSNTNADRLESGLNRNLNHDKYYTFSYESENKLEKIGV